MKQRTNKLARLEKNRKSIITEDLTHCIICGNLKQHLHEVFYGRNRLNSIKYGMVMPICFNCHKTIHNNIDMDMYYKMLFQKEYEKTHTRDEFISIFYKNYLD